MGCGLSYFSIIFSQLGGMLLFVSFISDILLFLNFSEDNLKSTSKIYYKK